jgi:signal transduction histidine kinase
VALAVLGWFVYIQVLPATFDQPFSGSFIPSYLLFLGLDAFLVALYFVVGLRCGLPRWRVYYWAVGAGVLAIAVTDSIDLLNEAGILSWPSGAPTDLIWGLPPTAFLVAVRMRHVPLGGADPAPDRPRLTLEERARSGAVILIAALSFPLVHIWLHDLLVLKPALERAQSALVLVMLGLLGTLAARMYGLLGRRHQNLALTRLALEDQLRETQRFEAVGRLAGGVAHDFNNVLTSIVGHNELALDGLADDDPARPAIGEIAKAAARATAVTKQLLAFSRRQILKPVRTSLNTIVTSAVPVLARVIGEDITVRTDLAPDLVNVTVDPDQVQSVIYALAVRAREAMPRGGTLAIATRTLRLAPAPGHPGGAAAELSVRDSGTAFDAAVLPLVFEPYVTGARDKGLGLAAVYGIVTQSGGTITAGTPEGGGTIFRIVLPAT